MNSFRAEGASVWSLISSVCSQETFSICRSHKTISEDSHSLISLTSIVLRDGLTNFFVKFEILFLAKKRTKTIHRVVKKLVNRSFAWPYFLILYMRSSFYSIASLNKYLSILVVVFHMTGVSQYSDIFPH